MTNHSKSIFCNYLCMDTHCFLCLWLGGAECAHSYAQKACGEKIYRGEVIFFARLFFHRKNSAYHA